MEIAFRYSRLDLDDRGIEGGLLNDFTLGFNWYPNDSARLMLNAVRAERKGLETVWIAQARIQWAY